MSIRLKLTIMFLAIASIPLLFVSVLTFSNYKKSIETNRLSDLRNVAFYKADKIETYFAGLKAKTEIVQNSYLAKKDFPILIQFADDQANPAFAAAQKEFDEISKKTTTILGLSDIMLVSPKGKVVYANRPGHYSKDFFKGPFDVEQKAFTQGKEGICFSDVYFDKAEDNRY